jgi:hypothetical protein
MVPREEERDMLTKAHIEQAQSAHAAVGDEHGDMIAAICVLALQALDMQPRPISEAPRDGRWFIAFATALGWEATKCVHFADAYDRLPIHGEFDAWPSAPTHFIPLSSLPQVMP